MKQPRHFASIPWIGALALVALCPPALVAQELEPSYGYFRTIEGSARLTGASEPEAIEVEANYPVLDGDRVWVTPGARLEAVLPDGGIVRLGGGTDLFLDRLAASYESEDSEGNVLRLFEGELQVVIEQALPGVEPTRIDTGNTTIYLPAPGVYRVTADESGWTEVVVRQGWAEVATEQGSSVVRSGESAVIEGRSRPGISLVAAAGPDRLELWGESLTAGALPAAATPHVAQPLRYAAAPLSQHGAWVSVGNTWAWRPRVGFGWRPYTAGRWIYTPAGITWVSAEPWGWVTSHYGSWDNSPGFGWVWFPGHVYSPAWVYWYWGPSHVAWVPSGFYTRFYGHSGFSLSFNYGVYGWAGGPWDSWSRWTFCPTRYFGHSQYRSYWRSGAELHHGGRYAAVPRGIVTNDTRPLRPERWARPREATFALEEQYRIRRQAVSGVGTRSLPDVSGFVARQKELASDTRAAVFKAKLDGRPATRVPTDRGLSGGSVTSRSTALDSQGAPWRTEKVVRRDAAGVSRSRTGGIEGTSAGVRSRSIETRGEAVDKRDLVGSDSRSPVVGGGLRSRSTDTGVTASPRDRSAVSSPGAASAGSRPLIGGERSSLARPYLAPSPRDSGGSGLLSDTRRPGSAVGSTRSSTSVIPPSPRFSTPADSRESSPRLRTPVETPLVQRIVGGARSSGAAEGGSKAEAPTGVRRSSPSGDSGRGSSSSTVKPPPSRSPSSGAVQRSSPSRSSSSARSSSSPRSQSRSSGRSGATRSKRKSKPNG